METVFLLLAFLLSGVLVSALLVWGGARLAKAKRAHLGWAFVAVLVGWVVHVAVSLPTWWIEPRSLEGMLILFGGFLIVHFLLSGLALATVLGTTFLRAAGIWLLQMVGGARVHNRIGVHRPRLVL